MGTSRRSPDLRSLDLDDAVGDAAADDDDRRHADQLGVLELDAGGHRVAVVEQDSHAGRLEVGAELFGGRPLLAAGLAGDDDMDVGGGDLARPAQAELVARQLGDGGDGP